MSTRFYIFPSPQRPGIGVASKRGYSIVSGVLLGLGLLVFVLSDAWARR